MPRRKKDKRTPVTAVSNTKETEVVPVLEQQPVEVKNETLYKQCFTFVTAKGHQSVTLRPGESIEFDGVDWASIKYYITNNNLTVNHGSL